MKTLRPACVPSVLLVLFILTGCGSIEFQPYAGSQKDWPLHNGAFVTQVAGMPIYHGLPSRPYTVLGRAIGSDATDIALARYARTRGADALIITDSHTLDAGAMHLPGASTTSHYGTTSITTATPSYTMPVTETITTAWLIKFIPEN